MTTPLHPTARARANTLIDLTGRQPRSTEWHREYRKNNPTAAQRHRDACRRYHLRRRRADAISVLMHIASELIGRHVEHQHAQLTEGLHALASALDQSEAFDGSTD